MAQFRGVKSHNVNIIEWLHHRMVTLQNVNITKWHHYRTAQYRKVNHRTVTSQKGTITEWYHHRMVTVSTIIVVLFVQRKSGYGSQMGMYCSTQWRERSYNNNNNKE